MSKNKEIKVIELFAGVGGFRVGLEKASKKYNTVWSNQWEPATKKQYASEIYVKRFGAKGHSNKNISEVLTKDIPDFDLMVGGFPCQDYSVAKTLSRSSGLEGKKGVLWWDIHRILKEKKKKPEFLLLENVDRLLKSPIKQRGRDFAIMISSLSDLGYITEWRVINAADYGMPQRRRRVFFMAYHKTSSIYKEIVKLKDPVEWITKKGLVADTFKVKYETKHINNFNIEGDLPTITKEFNKKGGDSPFENCGIMINRKVYTIETKPDYKGKVVKLKDIILLNGAVPEQYYIDKKSLKQWEYLKGAKKEQRVNKASGFKYSYNEGAMVFPDSLEKPSRTIITGEGGPSPSRFKHVIETKDGRYRRLMPLELERLNMFPDNHTEGASDIKRAFFMGNALVVGIVEELGKALIKRM